MTDTPSTPAPDAPPDWESPDARTARQVAVLRELVEIGLLVARSVRRQVEAADEPAVADDDAPAPTPLHTDPGLALSRITRAIRLSFAMENRLMEEASARRAGQDEVRAQAEGRRQAERKQLVGRIVGEAIEDEVEDDDEFHMLSAALRERLEDEESWAELAGRPVGEQVATLCRDLSLSPDWSQWADETWAMAEARKRPDGSPFAAGPVLVGADHRPAPDAHPP